MEPYQEGERGKGPCGQGLPLNDCLNFRFGKTLSSIKVIYIFNYRSEPTELEEEDVHQIISNFCPITRLQYI